MKRVTVLLATVFLAIQVFAVQESVEKIKLTYNGDLIGKVKSLSSVKKSEFEASKDLGL